MIESPSLNALRQKFRHQPTAPAAARHLAAALLGSDPGPHRLDDLPAFVQDELAGIAVARKRADVKRHLDLCPNCFNEYLALLQSLQSEIEEPVRRPEKMRRPNLSFLPAPSLPEIARQIAEQMLGSLAPHQLPNLEQVVGSFVRRLAAAGSAPDLSAAYQPVLSEPIEAFQVFIFAYYTSRTLDAQPAGRDWDASVAEATQSIARQMRLPMPVAAALAQSYAAGVVEWREQLHSAS